MAAWNPKIAWSFQRRQSICIWQGLFSPLGTGTLAGSEGLCSSPSVFYVLMSDRWGIIYSAMQRRRKTMCMACGGICGGLGEALLAFGLQLGLPFVIVNFSRMKKWLATIKDKITGRDTEAEKIPQVMGCECCHEPIGQCQQLDSPENDTEYLMELASLQFNLWHSYLIETRVHTSDSLSDLN